MQPEQRGELIPIELRDQLTALGEGVLYERRSVIARAATAPDGWLILGCVIRPRTEDMTGLLEESHSYANALLTRDFLKPAELEAFLLGLPSIVKIGHLKLSASFYGSCRVERVGVQNAYMEEAGIVFSWTGQSRSSTPGPLLGVGKSPFYPDAIDAAADWLRLREYHVPNDGRKGSVMLLMPERRAFMEKASWPDQERLCISIGGPLQAALPLLLKGAYWCGSRIQQVHVPITDGTGVIALPGEADRLELYVMGEDGTVFDFHQEHAGYPTGPRRFLPARHSRSRSASPHRVVDAMQQGENLRIEFKQFLELPNPDDRRSDENRDSRKREAGARDKFDQVVCAVAAFANTDGGTIYFGVSDNCQLVGAERGLLAWGHEKLTDEVIGKYMGVLRTAIREAMHEAALNLTTSADFVGEHLVIALDVGASPVPITVRSGNRFLMRRSGTSSIVPVSEWHARRAAAQH